MKKIISILLILILMLSTISTVANEDTTTAVDISMPKVSNWAIEYVLGAEKMDICTFDDYTLPTTRIEFCEMIYNMIRISPAPFSTVEEQENKFNDTNSIAVNYLNEIGVINGTSENTFSPNDKIYREEVAMIVYRLAKKLYLQGFYDDYKLSSYIYVDQNKISEWAIESVSQLKAVKLMDGIGNDMFAPKAVFTREQAVVLTMKL